MQKRAPKKLKTKFNIYFLIRQKTQTPAGYPIKSFYIFPKIQPQKKTTMIGNILGNILGSILPIKLPGLDPVSDAQKAAERALQKQEITTANNTVKAANAASSKSITDTNNSIKNLHIDSATKATNAVTKAAQGIQF